MYNFYKIVNNIIYMLKNNRSLPNKTYAIILID